MRADQRTHRSLGYLLNTCHSLTNTLGAMMLDEHELTCAQWVALVKLDEGAAASASELCRLMHYNNGAMIRLLDQLQARGFVKRRRNAKDRRIVNVTPTRAGKAKVSELQPRLAKTLNSALGDFTDAEYSELLRLIAKLTSRMRAYLVTAEQAD